MKRVLEQIAKALDDATESGVSASDIKESPKADYASAIAFSLAKKRGVNPAEVAEEVAVKITKPDCVKEIKADGGFINFSLDYSAIAKDVLSDAVKTNYGCGIKQKEKIVLEHTSVNPSGPVHVGRLRNSLIGDSLRRILVHAGYDVETHYFVNNIGKQISIIALGLAEGIEGETEVIEKYEKYAGKDDFRAFFTYVEANKKFESDDEFKERVEKLIRDAEAGDEKVMQQITDTANKSLVGQKQTYDRLGFVFDEFDYESEEITRARAEKVLSKLKKNKEWTSKEDVGAGVDLSSFGIEKKTGFTVLERADGTTVYTARDLAYHLQKLCLGDRLINVLGEDHKLQAKELDIILRNFLGVKKPIDVVHYSFVSFEGAKLSTRRGDTAPVDELLDEAIAKARKEVEKREIAGEDAAEKIGVGAVKYHIVKTNANKPITFRWDDALSFEGDASPYIQYAHARCCRILEKAGVDASKINASELECENLTSEEEKVLKLLGSFPLVVEEASRKLQPHLIANYVYDLASAYSRFYKNCQVISDDDVVEHRLLIVDAVRNTLKIGLGLLGIEAPERM